MNQSRWRRLHHRLSWRRRQLQACVEWGAGKHCPALRLGMEFFQKVRRLKQPFICPTGLPNNTLRTCLGQAQSKVQRTLRVLRAQWKCRRLCTGRLAQGFQRVTATLYRPALAFSELCPETPAEHLHQMRGAPLCSDEMVGFETVVVRPSTELRLPACSMSHVELPWANSGFKALAHGSHQACLRSIVDP